VTGTDWLPHTSRRRARQLMLGALEFPRAAHEFGAMMAAVPLLASAAGADGRPVLVIPGLSGGNGWTTAIRSYLGSLGHSVYGPRFAANKGTPARVLRCLAEQLDDLAAQHDQRVGLVGWSVGGSIAREVAKRHRGRVRQVITLGAPLGSTRQALHGRPAAPPQPRVGLPAPGFAVLPVPSTVIYSRTDGVFDWRRYPQDDGPDSENIVVLGSHLGMAHNPAVLHVLADRLAQPDGRWSPYRPPRELRCLFPVR
jgi:pimeloyl-ACP methyl ester carboxylesterase